jgi:hypothetical protein
VLRLRFLEFSDSWDDFVVDAGCGCSSAPYAQTNGQNCRSRRFCVRHCVAAKLPRKRMCGEFGPVKWI